VKVLGKGYLSLLEDIQPRLILLFLSYSFGSILYHCTPIYGLRFVCFHLILYIIYSYCCVYVFLFLCMLRSRCCVSLRCSVHCLCINVLCTTATGYQPNCS
jgi:hypothetical protein